MYDILDGNKMTQVDRQATFARFVQMFVSDLTPQTAQKIADELDVSFFVEEYI